MQQTAQLQPWKVPQSTSACNSPPLAECELPPGAEAAVTPMGSPPHRCGGCEGTDLGLPPGPARDRVLSAHRPCGPGSLTSITFCYWARNQAREHTRGTSMCFSSSLRGSLGPVASGRPGTVFPVGCKTRQTLASASPDFVRSSCGAFGRTRWRQDSALPWF